MLNMQDPLSQCFGLTAKFWKLKISYVDLQESWIWVIFVIINKSNNFIKRLKEGNINL